MKFLATFLLLTPLINCQQGCGQKNNNYKVEKVSKPVNQTIRILALGDSYTIGEAVEPHERWVMQLAGMMRENKLEVAEPRIIARTGWTTADLATAIAAENPPKDFDMVTLLIGVNNQYQGKSIDEYRMEFSSLLEKAVEFARGKKENVFVISIPDWGVTPFAAGRDREKIGREIDEFNRVNQDISGKMGISYTDITPGSKNAISDGTLLASDGLHPSGKMYKEWAEKLLPSCLRVFSGR